MLRCLRKVSTLWCLFLLSLFTTSHANAAPSLLKDSDIPSRHGSVKKRILDSYVFVGDFYVRERPEIPPGWISHKAHPETGLLYGKPTSVKRPSSDVEVPYFPLTKLSYFQGEDELTTQLNAIVTYWSKGMVQQAHELFTSLRETTKKLPPGHVTGTALRLLRAYFYLYLAARTDVQVFGEGVGGNMVPHPADLHLHTVHSAFWDVVSKSDFSRFATALDKSVNVDIYQGLWEHPYFLENGKLVGEKKVEMALIPKPIDTLVWIRSVFLAAAWNAGVSLRKFEAWTEFFKSGDKIDDVITSLNGVLPTPKVAAAIAKVKRPLLNQRIKLSPKNSKDLQAAMYTMQAVALRADNDPFEILQEADKIIRTAISDDLKAYAFQMAGEVYFDLNNYYLARRTYAWAEAVSDFYTENYPAALFYGAESAFWMGDYKTAKAGFDRFLYMSGDREFGPWARLRLAEIAHIGGDKVTAEQRYEELLRFNDDHPVSKDAVVRLFCQNIGTLGPRALRVKYDETVAAIKDSSDALKAQAKACLLKADLNRMAGASSSERRLAQTEAQEQIAAIEEFKEEFPDSEYLDLFSDRVQKLKMTEAMYLASESQCEKLIQFYKLNEKQLNAISQKETAYLKSLKWEKQDRVKLLRCAAILSDTNLERKLSKTDVASEGGKIRNALFEFYRKKNDVSATNLFKSLQNQEKKDWKRVVSDTEQKGDSLTRDTGFWRMMAIQRLVAFDLATPRKQKNKLRQTIVAEVLKKPSTLHESEILCSVALQESHAFGPRQWDIITKSLPARVWLETAEKEQKDADNVTCKKRIADQVVAMAPVKPSPYRDKNILLPYLEKLGIASASELWLSYAERQAHLNGPLDKNTRKLFKKIYDEAQEVLVKAAAKAWLEKNVEPNTSLL